MTITQLFLLLWLLAVPAWETVAVANPHIDTVTQTVSTLGYAHPWIPWAYLAGVAFLFFHFWPEVLRG